jgi:glutaredoxin
VIEQQANGQLRTHFEISIFGKPDCDLCKSAERKVAFFLNQWDLRDRVALRFHDLTTVEGLTEGAYHNATDVPTTLVLADGRTVARWDIVMPPSEELRRALTEC